MAWSLAAVVAGLVVLAWASEHFVTGAVRIAAILDVSPMLVGVVVVGFGASAPEVVVAAVAASQGDVDLAVGNVVGSNAANVGLVLPLAALAGPLAVGRATLRREVPIAAATCVLFVALLPGGLGWADGVALLGLLVVLTALLVRSEATVGALGVLEEAGERLEPAGAGRSRPAVELVRLLAGLAVVVGAAHLLVSAAVDLAREVGISEGFAGMTILAVGTALPELSTGIVATRRGHGSLVVGNLLGSIVANSLLVGGVIGIAGGGAPLVDPDLVRRASAVTAVVFLVGFLAVRGGRPVRRLPALALLGLYLLALPLLA